MQLGYDARFADHFLYLEAARRENASDIGGGLIFLSAQFGMAMEMATNLDETGRELLGEVFNLSEHRRSGKQVSVFLVHAQLRAGQHPVQQLRDAGSAADLRAPSRSADSCMEC